MIRISKLADYAFVLLAHMGNLQQEKKKDLWTASDLSQATDLPLPTVAKILKILARNEILSAQRGAAGGYRFARTVHEIRVSDIVEAVDGPIALTCCATAHKKKDCVRATCPIRENCRSSCSLHKNCRLSEGWRKMNDALRENMAGISLAELSGLNEEMELDPVV